MNSPGFLLIIIAFAFLYFVLVRPQRRRQLAAQRMLDSITVGAEVVTAGGLYGKVTAIEDDTLLLEIAPQLEVRVARRAIGGVVPPPEPEEPEEPEDAAEPEEPAEPEPGAEQEHAGPAEKM